jgi:hypothetical protein
MCGLLFLISIIAYDRSGVPRYGARDLLAALPSAAATAPGLTTMDIDAPTKLSDYIYLHETRNASDLLQGAARAPVCAK